MYVCMYVCISTPNNIDSVYSLNTFIDIQEPKIMKINILHIHTYIHTYIHDYMRNSPRVATVVFLSGLDETGAEEKENSLLHRHVALAVS
jgi:hypothetical protein